MRESRLQRRLVHAAPARDEASDATAKQQECRGLWDRRTLQPNVGEREDVVVVVEIVQGIERVSVFETNDGLTRHQSLQDEERQCARRERWRCDVVEGIIADERLRDEVGGRK